MPELEKPPVSPEQATNPIETMGDAVRQFAADIAKANEAARARLGTTAVGHMLAGIAPLAVGIMSRELVDRMMQGLEKPQMETELKITQRQATGSSQPQTTETVTWQRPRRTFIENVLPGLTGKAVVEFKTGHPILAAIAENIGTSIAYNTLIARQSQGALPFVSSADVGIGIAGDVVAESAQKYRPWLTSARTPGAIPRWKKAGLAILDTVDTHVGTRVQPLTDALARGLSYSSGPTVLGLRMMAEGVGALAEQYRYIQRARKNPNEPKPYYPPRETKPWEQRDRGGRRDDRGHRRVYYGQGRGGYGKRTY